MIFVRSSTFLPLASLPGLLLFLLVGCGPRYGNLAGSVSFEGKPVRMGSVLVVGSDGVPRSTTIQDDGSYAVDNVPIGTVRIAVSSPDPETMVVSLPKHGRIRQDNTVDNTKWFPIPEKYAEFDQSDLTCTVKTGSNRFNIELK